ncbi:anti-sigma factor [Glaciihabitans sp. dw_435]|uniref:anti-sigma factor n=1 Tax=Glaciihabitans sp. dw_435 TaxID=2720081 RepID=UPI0027DACA1C|nr:anti-sigma factor [Glaciihabitans sp. dw_435]
MTELTDTAALLGLAVEPVQPSATLKANIMSMIASTPQLPREVAPVRTLQSVASLAPEAVDAPAASAETPDAPTAVTRKAQARWFSRPVAALTAVAAAVAIIVSGGLIANSLSSSNFQQQQASQLAAITSSADMQQAAPTPVSTGGTATLVWSEDLGKSAMILNGVKSLPDNKTYELWYIDAAGAATSAGLLDSDSSDKIWRVLDGTASAGLTVGVTVEPNGGSDAPTTAPIVAIPVA